MTPNSTTPKSLADLSSAALATRVTELLGHERLCIVDLLWHLAEMDKRGTHLELGYSSLFTYCTDALRLPRASAYRRTTAARLLTQFPSAAEYLADGRLCLTTFVLLRDVLKPENHLDILERAAGKTEDEVNVLVATLMPRPEVKDSIRRVPSRPAPAVESPLFAAAPVAASPTPAAELPVAPAPLAPPPPRPKIEPIDAERRAIKMTVGKEFIDELEQVKAALSHIVPDGNLEDVLRICMQRTLESCARKKRGAPKARAPKKAHASPAGRSSGPELEQHAAEPVRSSGPEPTRCSSTTERAASSGPELTRQRTRYIPADVRRQVWERDEGRCSFVGAQGKRCGSTHQIEFDHLVAFAHGGAATAENLALRCRAHNQHRARQQFGEAHMAQFTRSG